MKKSLVAVLCVIMLVLSIATLSACKNRTTKVKEITVSFVVDDAVYTTVKTDGKSSVSIPAAPTKEGYTFGGWYLDKDSWAKVFTATTLQSEAVTIDVSVYARFVVNTYTVNYVDENGTHANPTAYTVEDEINLQAAAKPGYTFAGWYADEARTQPIASIAKGTTGDMTLYAKYQAISYTITFENTMDASNLNPTTYTVENGVLTLLPLKMDGYTFLGWTDENGTEVTSFAVENLGDHTLIAHWTLDHYTITYENTKGAANVNPTAYTAESGAITLWPLSVDGYIFRGWTMNGKAIDAIRNMYNDLTLVANWQPVEYGVTFVADGETVATLPATVETLSLDEPTVPAKRGYEGEWASYVLPVDGNVTVEAIYTPVTYTLTYILDGEYEIADITNDNPLTYTVESEAIVLAPIACAGYTFEGWVDESEEPIEEIAAGSVGDRTISAVWTPILYAVTYQNTKGAANANPQSFTVLDAAIDLVPLTVDGYTFVGWTRDGELITRIEGVFESVTLVAEWQTITYSIDFVADGISVISIPVTVETTAIEAPAVPAKSGYNGQWETYALPVEGDITVNAVYTVILYSITYNVAGDYDIGEIVNDNPTAYSVESATITLSAPQKIGYTFVAWKDEHGDVITQIAAGGTGDRTLTANWSAIPYTLTYVTFGPDGVTPCGYLKGEGNPATYTVEDAFALARLQSNDDAYEFKGWYTQKTDGELCAAIEAGTTYGDKTLYAQWMLSNYTITYANTDGATHTNPLAYSEVSPTFTLTDAHKAGYSFTGWTEYDEDAHAYVPADTTIALGSRGARNFYANWQIIEYDIIYNSFGGNLAEGDTNPATYTIETPTITLAPVAKVGYTFIGWYDHAVDGTEIAVIEQGSTGVLQLYAQYTLNTYAISYRYIVNGEETTNEAIQNANPTAYTVLENDIVPANATLEGYSFVGWYTEAACVNKIDKITVGTAADMVLYGKLVNYAITYMDIRDGDENANPATYCLDQATVTLSAAVRVGHTFHGWYTQPNGEGDIITAFATADQEDKVLYAYFTADLHTITFDSRGGTDVDTIRQAYGTTVSAPNTPFRKGYAFEGWYEEEADAPYIFATIEARDVTLTASWSVVTYMVQYVLDGADNAPANPTAFLLADLPIALAAASRTGYTFNGWYTDSDFDEADKIDAITDTPAVGTTVYVYAKTTAITYAITYDSRGGTAVAPTYRTYGAAVSAPVAPTKTGYVFDGWYEEDELYAFDTMPARDVALTAAWTPETYSLTFVLSGGSYQEGQSNPEGYTIETATFALTPVVKNGYTFDGWYEDGKKVTSIAKGSYGNRTFVANFEAITYTITYQDLFDADNTNPTTYTVESDTIVLTDLHRVGYFFAGWLRGNELVTNIANGTTGDITLTATWEAAYYTVYLNREENQTFTVTFDLNGASGTAPTAQTIGNNDALAYPTVPARAGYAFGGWYDNEQCAGRVFDFGATVVADVTLYAKWIEATGRTVTLGAESRTVTDVIAVGGTKALSIDGVTYFVYALVPTASGNISVYTEGDIDTIGYLYSEYGTLLVSHDDVSDEDKNFLFNYNVSANRLYYVALRGANPDEQGDSTLRIDGATAVADGGTLSPSGHTTVYYGQCFTLDVPEAVDGYTFRGWYTAVNGGGVQYTDETGSSLRDWDIDGNATLYAYLQRQEYTVTFVTGQGTKIDPVTLAYGDRLDINSYVTTRQNYSFTGWYLAQSDANPYEATTMPDHDVTLYAKWKAYGLNNIKYNAAKTAVRADDTIDADLFSVTLYDTDGKQVEVNAEVVGTQTAGQTITILYYAEVTIGTKTYSKDLTIENVRVYGAPTITYDTTRDYINNRLDTFGSVESQLAATATDTFGDAVSVTADLPLTTISTNEYGGEIVSVTLRAVDVAGNVATLTVENIRNYDEPTINADYWYYIKVDDTISAELFDASAYDNFGEPLAVTATIVSGTFEAGKEINVLLSATDSKGNTAERTIYRVKVYGMPTIGEQTKFDYKVTDSVAYANLGMTAKDSFNLTLAPTLTLVDGEWVAGATLTYQVSATDRAGNTATATAQVRVYGAPTVTYDCDTLKADQDVQPYYLYTKSVTLSFDLNGGSEGQPAAQTIDNEHPMVYPTAIPTRDGFVFSGWYTTAVCETLFDFSRDIDADVTVYAGWIAHAGDGVLPINGTLYSLSVDSRYDSYSFKYYAFVPLTDGNVTIYSTGSNDTFGYLYAANKTTRLAYNNNGGSDGNFSITYAVTAGTLYYVVSCGYYYSMTIESVVMEGALYPAAGGSCGLLCNGLHATATDSFGEPLRVSITQAEGTFEAGGYVTYQVSATDAVGNSAAITTEAIPVYSAADISASMTYDAFSSDLASLLGHGEEFDAYAEDSFGNPCAVSLVAASGDALVAGTIVDIRLRFTDTAGNYVDSDVLSDIRLFGMPTTTYNREPKQVGDQTVTYWKLPSDTVLTLRTYFKSYDSFGDELSESITVLEEYKDENEVVTHIRVRLRITDDAANTLEREYVLCNDLGYTLSTATNMAGAGTYTLFDAVSVPCGANITLTATTNAGYTWVGWYDGDTKVSEGTSLTYIATMPAENKTYTAKWTYYTLSTTTDLTAAGTYTQKNAEKVTAGQEETLTAATNLGYTFLGWYDGDTKVSEGTSLSYTFAMPAENKTYTAKFEKCTAHTLDDNCICTKCGATAHGTKDGVYCRHGDYLYFGTYPQSEVTDSAIKSALNTAAGTLPTASNARAWTSYGYFISSSTSTDYMWYIDLTYGGEQYRGVYFTQYRPYYTSNSSSADNSYQDNNGYNTTTVYWFKYEPIKWRILSEADGVALIFAEMALDSQEYCHYTSTSQFSHNGGTGYPNNYALSNIRKWLNDAFYNTAFNDLQKQLILLTTVDNSARSTSDSGNNLTQASSYACANTEDYIFLLSEQEVTNSAYGFNSSCYNYDAARRKQNTDYAKCQGAWTSTDSSYKSNGHWWLRSPYYSDSSDARYVSYYGYAGNYRSVDLTGYGVVPALKISLS
ncbi:MAG: InlB B-repeat-containing protein [Clostridia bacterium]|nr:InlB B-repeat-containing protein [Clostridia bacterium]